MNRLLLPAIPLLLGSVLLQNCAWTQPEAKPGSPTTDTYSIVELEQFLGGRTLVTVDLKNATMTQVGAALSESTGLKIAPRNLRPSPPPNILTPNVIRQSGITPPPGSIRLPEATVPPEPTFTLAATKQPFWEALRDWSIASRNAAEEAKAEEAKKAATPQNGPAVPRPPFEVFPKAVQVLRGMNGWELFPGDNLADGRAVAAWPFLIIGSDLRRVQDGRLTDTGLEEPAPAPATAAPQVMATKPVPDEQRWQDRLLLTALVLPDPKLSPSNLRCEVTEAIDDKGLDLRAPRGETRRFSGSWSISGATPQFVLLASRPDMGKRLVRLRGTLGCDIVTRNHHWETTDLTKPVDDVLEGKGGDLKIQYKGMVPNGTTWKLTFEAQSRGSLLESFWKSKAESQATPTSVTGRSYGGIFGFTGDPGLRLLDAQGLVFIPGFSSSSSRLGRGPADAAASSPADFSTVPADIAQNWNYSETYSFDFTPPFIMGGASVVGLPSKLSFDFPIERRHVSVPFEFTDLPLPPSQYRP